MIPPSQGGGHFPWPLRGRVLASYGVATDGTHNDGINIAAARGTPIEAVEEKVSLSDRFGLWLGFHNVDQETYQAIVRGYAQHFGLDVPEAQLKAEANEWSITRGARSGRVAWQFIQDLAGRLGKPTT